MAKFYIECPCCNADLQVQDKFFGMKMRCPVCQNEFVLGKSVSGSRPHQISLLQYFLQATFCQYSSNGRACRKEFWGFELFWGIIFIILGMLASPLLAVADELDAKEIVLYLPVSILYTLLSVRVLARRLHDLGKCAKGWCIAYLTIAVFGFLNDSIFSNSALTVLCFTFDFLLLGIGCIKGNEGDNEFGEDPLESDYSFQKVDPLSVLCFLFAIIAGTVWQFVVYVEKLS